MSQAPLSSRIRRGRAPRNCSWCWAPDLGTTQQHHRQPLCLLPRGLRGASPLEDAATQPWEGCPCSGPSPIVPRGAPCSCGLERDLCPLLGSPMIRPCCREHVRQAAPLAPSKKQQAPPTLPGPWTLPHLGHLVGRMLVPALISQLCGAEASAVPGEGWEVTSPEVGWPGTVQDRPSGAPDPATDPASAGALFMGPKDRARCSCHQPGQSRWAERLVPRPQGSPLACTGLDSVDGQILGWLRLLTTEEEEEEGEEEGAMAASSPGPALPEMGSQELRLASFYAWPPSAAVPPVQLAAAGFFHTGQRDKVRCFFCSGGLQSWERGDDPWIEHATWFPRCEFLLQSKGRDFVRSVQASSARPLGSWGPPEEPEDAAPAATSAPVHGSPEPPMPRRSQAEGTGAADPEEQLQRLQEERRCKVCLDRAVSVVFVPCGHLACADCAPSLQLCPICRAPVGSRVRTFLS